MAASQPSMVDLPTLEALERAAAAKNDFFAMCYQRSFPDMAADKNAYPWWAGQTEAWKTVAVRQLTVALYAYLHFRSSQCPLLDAERIQLLTEIGDDWRPILAKTLAETDFSPRFPRLAFGADIADPVNGLRVFAWETHSRGALLAEAWRREELRRLEYKAFKMRSGQFDERAQQSDDSWRRRNDELFHDVDQLEALAIEAHNVATAAHPGEEREEIKPSQGSLF